MAFKALDVIYSGTPEDVLRIKISSKDESCPQLRKYTAEVIPLCAGFHTREPSLCHFASPFGFGIEVAQPCRSPPTPRHLGKVLLYGVKKEDRVLASKPTEYVSLYNRKYRTVSWSALSDPKAQGSSLRQAGAPRLSFVPESPVSARGHNFKTIFSFSSNFLKTFLKIKIFYFKIRIYGTEFFYNSWKSNPRLLLINLVQ